MPLKQLNFAFAFCLVTLFLEIGSLFGLIIAPSQPLLNESVCLSQ
jgi:hypothetical protein